MASFNCYVTDAGRALLATAEATAGIINFVNVQTGSGTLTLGQQPTSLTSLIVSKNTWAVDGSNALTPFQVTVQFTVNSASVTTTYANTEVGLFGRIGPTGALTMIWYGYTTTPDTFTPSGTGNATIDVNQLAIVLTNATTCIATQTPTIAVPPHAVTHITGGFDPLPTASSTTDGVVPITPNDVSKVLLGGPTAAFGGVPIATNIKQGGQPITPNDVGQVAIGGATASWGPVPLATAARPGATLALSTSQSDYWAGDGSWQPVYKRLTANVTLYVTTTGNDATGAPNDPAHPFLTIQGALNWTQIYFISSGLVVNINVAAGAYPTPFVVNHPQGGQIFISGVTSTVTATAASFSLGVVTLTGPFTGYAVGDIVMINNQQTVQGNCMSGAYVLTAASSTNISYATGYGSFTSFAGITSTAVTRLQSQLTMVSGGYIANCVSNLGGLTGFGLKKTGTAAGTGILAQLNAIVHCANLGLCNFSDPANVSIGGQSSTGAQLSFTTCYASRCTYGFLAQLGELNCSGCIANSNATGFSAQVSLTQCTNCIADINSSAGFSVTEAGTLTVAGCASNFNGYGILAQLNSMVLQGTGGNFTSNATKDVSLSIGSLFVHTTGASSTNGVVAPPTPNVVASDGSYYSP